MRRDELIVEVRDRTLARLGQIPTDDLVGQFRVADSAVGEWQIVLPADHPMAGPLRTPGAGIIVTGPAGVICSGPMTDAELDVDMKDQIGVVTIKGVTDEVILWDTLAWPTPSFDFSLGDYTMPDGYDTWAGTLPIDWLAAFNHYLDTNLGRYDIGMFGSLLSLQDFSLIGLGPIPVDGGGLTFPIDASGYLTDIASGPAPGTNLIANPGPVPSGSSAAPGSYGYVSGAFYDNTTVPPTSQPDTKTEWEVTPMSIRYRGDYEQCSPPPDYGLWSYVATTRVTSADTLYWEKPWRVWPSDLGYGVEAGRSYQLTVQCANISNVSRPAVGVVWLDSAGAIISEALGALTTVVDDLATYWRYLVGSVPDGYVGPAATPTATLTAPAGAVTGRPFLEFEKAQGSTHYVHNFRMVAL